MAILVVGCNKRPLEKSDDINRMKVTYFGALNVQKTSVELHWGCSSETVGYLMYGKTGTENIQYLWLPSKQHFYNVTGLTLGNTYKAIAFCAASGDDAVYLMGGSVTNTVTASLPNVIYRFIPENGTSGQWDALTTSVSIPARTDFAGCSTGGTVYFNNGRANDGIAQLVSDAYIPSGNTISSTNEASFSVAAFGAASACYRTRPLGPYTQDNPAMFVLGGSTLDNTDQPPTAILASNRFEYYLTPSDTGTNVVSVGPNLPNSLYYPAAEISYEKRKIYVFEGANVVNVPTSKVYSLYLADPSQGTWTTESKDMPVARFGHKAVIINR